MAELLRTLQQTLRYSVVVSGHHTGCCEVLEEGRHGNITNTSNANEKLNSEISGGGGRKAYKSPAGTKEGAACCIISHWPTRCYQEAL